MNMQVRLCVETVTDCREKCKQIVGANFATPDIYLV